MAQHLTVHTDGSFSVHSKKMYIGVHSDLFRISKEVYHKKNSSMISEYLAILEALKATKKHGITEIKIKSDSLIAINELNQQKPVTCTHQQDIFFKIKEFITHNDLKVTFAYHPRNKNHKAHCLANKHILAEAQV